jgi:hypothetical protein
MRPAGVAADWSDSAVPGVTLMTFENSLSTWVHMGVQTAPGAMALTRMPWRISS